MASKGYHTKKLKGKGAKKWRQCLGSECPKKILTTPDTRLCLQCKRALEGTNSDSEFKVVF